MTARHVTRGAVARAVQSTLQAWLPYGLWEVATFEGSPVPANVVSWSRPSSPELTTDDQLPMLAVTSTGVSDTTRHGAGGWDASWSVTVSVWVRGSSVEEVADLVGLYTAAVRAVGVHKPAWGGLASSSFWEREQYNLVDANDTRTLGRGDVEFAVTVGGVVDEVGWPATPPASPWPYPTHTADTIDLDVERLIP